jgi:hypothetical protein
MFGLVSRMKEKKGHTREDEERDERSERACGVLALGYCMRLAKSVRFLPFAGLHPVGSNMELRACDLDVLMVIRVPCKVRSKAEKLLPLSWSGSGRAQWCQRTQRRRIRHSMYAHAACPADYWAEKGRLFDTRHLT